METWSDKGDEQDNVIILPPPTIIPQKKTTANRSLLQKIESIIASYELQEKYSTLLTVYTLTIIEKLIKSKPEFFRIVESTLVRNINGSVLHAIDVPYIISIISMLYNLLFELKIDHMQYIEIPADTCGHLLKFIISVAIRERIIKIEDETEATLLILCCDNIIDACTRLLKIKHVLRKPDPPPTPPPPPPVFERKLEPVKEVEKTDCCC
jgi:hypothetical protein